MRRWFSTFLACPLLSRAKIIERAFSHLSLDPFPARSVFYWFSTFTLVRVLGQGKGTCAIIPFMIVLLLEMSPTAIGLPPLRSNVGKYPSMVSPAFETARLFPPGRTTSFSREPISIAPPNYYAPPPFRSLAEDFPHTVMASFRPFGTSYPSDNPRLPPA